MDNMVINYTQLKSNLFKERMTRNTVTKRKLNMNTHKISPPEIIEKDINDYQYSSIFDTNFSVS